MKKEKTIKTYQRRTKSGKVVTVKQHTAKYDAADKAKEMATKKGAGDELAAKKGMPDHNLPMNEYLEELKKLRKGETPEETPVEKETKKSSPSAEKKAKSVKSTKTTKSAATTQANGVSASDFKSWYHFNDWDKPKKSWPAEVRAADAAIRKQLGSKKAYDDYCAQIDGSYSKSGHNKAFKSFGGAATSMSAKSSPEVKSAKSKPKDSAWYDKPYEGAYNRTSATPQHKAVIDYVDKISSTNKSTPFRKYVEGLFSKGLDNYESLKPAHWKKLYALMQAEKGSKSSPKIKSEKISKVSDTSYSAAKAKTATKGKSAPFSKPPVDTGSTKGKKVSSVKNPKRESPSQTSERVRNSIKGYSDLKKAGWKSVSRKNDAPNARGSMRYLVSPDGTKEVQYRIVKPKNSWEPKSYVLMGEPTKVSSKKR